MVHVAQAFSLGMQPLPNPIVTSLTVGVVGILSKAFLNLCCTTQVRGLEHLYKAWDDKNRVNKGILTVSNHISVLDDPLMWGILPTRSFFSNRNSRWTLGARDILFTNPLYSTIFRNGKVIDTVRGVGKYQSAVDLATQRLDAGDWVHIFPQGFVQQQTLTPPIKRLKWGIGRILAECENTPTVIPMWINGFETIMPENRGFPRFLPRLNNTLKIEFDQPDTLTEALQKERELWHKEGNISTHQTHSNVSSLHIKLTASVEQALDSLGNKAAIDH